MKYFITGGAGFIGSNMADWLLKDRENTVIVYDNLCSGKKEFIKKHLDKKNFRFVRAEISDFNRLKKEMAGLDMVFHFAANPDIARSMKETDLDIREGILLTYNVLEAMRLNGIKKIAYSSGSGVYGEAGLKKTGEDYSPLFPISMYGASKLSCEAIISAFCHLYDMKAWIFRFANVVGGRQTHGVGYDFIKKLKKEPKELLILGDGTQSKSYVYVKDVISAMNYCISIKQNENPPHSAPQSPLVRGAKINIFNVATEDYITVREIAKIVIKEMDLSGVKIIHTAGDRGWKGDVPVVRFDLKRIHKLGWKAGTNSEQAIKRSIREMLGKA